MTAALVCVPAANIEESLVESRLARLLVKLLFIWYGEASQSLRISPLLLQPFLPRQGLTGPTI